MSQIKDYRILGELTDDTTFVVETADGTRRVPYSMLDDKMDDKLNNGGIGEAKAVANNALTVAGNAVEIAEHTQEIADGISQKNIKNAYISKGHLFIVLSDEAETTIDAGVVNDGFAQYGVCRDVDSHSPTLTRVGAAIGLEANVGIGSAKVKNDFDDIYPWSEMRKCTVAVDGTVTSYEGDASYREDGSMGQVMVEIPKFYIKQFVDEITHKEYTYICKEQLSDYRLPQAFYNKDGDELDAIYIGAYVGSENENGDLESVSGLRKYITEFHNLATYREMATKSRNNNWHLFDAMEYIDVIVPLFTVEFATLDSHSVMQGYRNYSDETFIVTNNDTTEAKTNILKTYDFENIDDFPFIVGQEILIPYNYENIDEVDDTDDINYWADFMEDTDHNVYAVRRITSITTAFDDVEQCNYIVVGFSGSPIYAEDGLEIYLQGDRCGITNEIVASSGYLDAKIENASAFVYRGLENLYGSGWYNWLDGILMVRNTYYVCDDITKYSSVVTNDYVALSYNRPIKSGFITQLGVDAEHPWARFPSILGGTSEQDYCDYMYTYSSGTVANPYGYRFGDSGVDSSWGLLAAYTNSNASYANYDVARLSYKSFN